MDNGGSMPEKRERDFTKYMFNGEKQGKGRLVLAVVKKYVAENPDISFNDLKMVFPDCLQGDSELQFSGTHVVFSKIDKIETGEMKRFFTKEEELLQIKDCEIAVCREWNYQNIQNFIGSASKLGYEIKAAR